MWNLTFVVENKKKNIKTTKHNKSYIGETTAYCSQRISRHINNNLKRHNNNMI